MSVDPRMDTKRFWTWWFVDAFFLTWVGPLVHFWHQSKGMDFEGALIAGVVIPAAYAGWEMYSNRKRMLALLSNSAMNQAARALMGDLEMMALATALARAMMEALVVCFVVAWLWIPTLGSGIFALGSAIFFVGYFGMGTAYRIRYWAVLEELNAEPPPHA